MTGKRIFIGRGDSVSLFENNLVSVKFANGEVVDALEPRRLFPVNNASAYITLLNRDGNEVAVIRNLSDLDGSDRRVIECSLNDYYFVPNILRIISKIEKHGRLHLTVETDRGVKNFDIKDRNHDIRVYENGCVRIRDSNDNRYVIPDYYNLDKQSQKYLISYI